MTPDPSSAGVETRLRVLVRRLASRLPDVREERGDVPGWVLITLMTAGLVVLLWALAGPALADVFENAISKVSGL